METEAEPIGTSNFTENSITLAIQAAIQNIVIEGTRYAVELKASDKLIDRNAELLRKDPSNPTLRSDQTRKIAARTESLNQIQALSTRLSNQLEQVFLQNLPQPSLKPDPAHALPDNRPPDSENILALVQDRFEFLENQILKNQQGLEIIHQDQQKVIETLREQINTQNEEISNLKNIIQESTSIAPNGNQENHNNDDKEEVGRSSVALELEEIRRDIREMSIKFDELQAKVITILTKEIPVNLQRSVRLIQKDVDSAAHTALTNGHKQITDLIRNLVSEFETRVATQERLSSRASASTEPCDPSKNNSPLVNLSSNSTAPISSSSKDPRILRRQSGLNSLPSEFKSNSETKCSQQ